MQQSGLIRFPYILFILCVLFFGFFSLANIDTHHDGLMLKPALDVVEGKILFRDTFTQYGAFTVYFQALAMKLFGSQLLALRFSTVLAYAGVAVLLWKIIRFLAPSVIAGAVFLLWIALAPIYGQYFHAWSSVYALLFQCLAILFLWKYIENQNRKYIFATGFCTAATFWSRQPVGIFLAVGVGFILLLFTDFRLTSPKRLPVNMLAFIAGMLLGVIPLLLYLHSNNAVWDFWLQSIALGQSFAHTIRGTGLRQILTGLFIPRCVLHSPNCWIWIMLPLTTIGLSGISFWRSLNSASVDHNNISLIVLGIISLASWMQYYPVPEPSHFFWAATPMFGLLAVLIRKMIFFPKINSKFFELGVYVVVLCFFGIRISEGYTRVMAAESYLERPPYFSGIRVTADEKQFYDQLTEVLAAYFKQFPTKTYINHSLDAMLVLLDSPHYYPAHKVYVNWDFVNFSIYPEYQDDVATYVQKTHPLIFTRDVSRFGDYCSIAVPSNQNPPVQLLIWRGDVELYSQLDVSVQHPVYCNTAN